MKFIFTFCIVMLICSNSFSQDITGQWNGALDIQGMQLRLVLHVNEAGDSLTSTLDSPDQGANGIPVSYTSFEDHTLTFKVDKLNIVYSGALEEGEIKGTFTQMGQQMPLILTRKEIEKKVVNRPQHPEKPYPYLEEEVTFPNEAADITLAGTLTLPKGSGPFPAAVLISGSGPQDRNEEIANHKPFLVIADHLTQQGIAVLRYDDRGVGASTGDFGSATSADFATDAKSAVAYLTSRQEIHHDQIGLIGHSEGGLIAPMTATTSEGVAFLVLLAGTGIQGNEILVKQTGLISAANGTSEEVVDVLVKDYRQLTNIVVQAEQQEDIKPSIEAYVKQRISEDPEILTQSGLSEQEHTKTVVDMFNTPWMTYFLKYDPAPTLEKVSCPVLALNGEKDLQVTPKENLEAIQQALEKGGNEQVTVKELPGLNHLFQESETGALSEYAVIEQTFSPVALNEISSWILELTK